MKRSRYCLEIPAFILSLGFATLSAVELNFDVDESGVEQSEPRITEPVVPAADAGDADSPLVVEGDSSDDLIPHESIGGTGLFGGIGKPSFSGMFVGRGDYFPDENPLEPGNDSYFSGYLKLDVLGDLGGDLRYQLSPKTYIDSDDRVSHRLEFREDSLRRPAATFDEAYIAWYPGNYEFIVGKQFVSWGTGDAFNPTDVVNPRDFLSVPDNFKIGVPAISAYRAGSLINFQIVGVPFFTPSRLPESDNRWSRSPENASRQFARRFGSRPLIIDQGRQEISDGWSSAQGGLQLSSSKLIEGWDLAVNYFHGYYSPGVIRQTVTAPTFAPAPGGGFIQTAPGSLAYRIFYPEYDQFGASFSTTAGDFEIHGEAAYHKTKNKVMDDDYIAYIFGVNHTVDDGLPSWIEKVTTVLEYAGEEIIRDRPRGSPFADAGFSRAFTNSVFTRVKVSFSEDTEFEIGGGLNLGSNDYTVSSALSHSFNEHVEVEVGVNVFAGDSDSFFGGWDENSRAYLQTTFYF